MRYDHGGALTKKKLWKRAVGGGAQTRREPHTARIGQRPVSYLVQLVIEEEYHLSRLIYYHNPNEKETKSQQGERERPKPIAVRRGGEAG